MEGFTNDVSLLRKQLASVDRKLHQMRLLDRLEDDDRLASVLQQLQKKVPGARDRAAPSRVRSLTLRCSHNLAACWGRFPGNWRLSA